MKAKKQLRPESEIAIDESAKIDQMIAEGFAMNLPSLSPEQIAEVNLRNETAFKISKAALKAIRENDLPYYFDDQISNKIIRLIGEFDFNYADAESTFRNLDLMLEDELYKMPEDDPSRRFLEQALSHLNFIAVSYFEKELVKEFEDTYLDEIAARCEATLEHLDHSEKFFRQAVANAKESNEVRLERQKKRAEDREAIKMFDDDDGENQRSPELTINRAIHILFELNPNLKQSTKTELAAFISFLTGFKSEQKIREAITYIYGRNNTSPKAHKEDVEKVKEWLNRIGLEVTPYQTNNSE